MNSPKGYKAVRRAVIEALEEGDYQHEARSSIDVKNLLATEEVTAAEVVALIRRSDGTQYTCSPLHGNTGLDCHLIKTGGWYVKFYFLDPTTVFISVHLTYH